MNRQITITILACLVGLWSAAASAQGKFNPNQVTPIVKPPPIIDPKVIDPKVKLLPPMAPPAAPTGGPVIEPIVKVPPMTPPADAGKLPPGTLPVDPTGGRISEHERQAIESIRDAARAGKLTDEESGLDATMGAGPGDDRPGLGADVGMHGFGKDDGTVMERFCKTKSARLFPGLCPGRGSDLPSDGDLSGFYNTKTPPSSTEPGGSMSLEGPRAGSRVSSRGGQASDDSVQHEESPDGKTSRDVWTEPDGTRHDWRYHMTADGNDATQYVVSNKDGTTLYVVDRVNFFDSTERDSNYVQRTTVYIPGFRPVITTRHCRGGGGDCTPDSQPGESGYGQAKARPWFCARNPKAKGCEPTAPGSQTDPANPDGEGTPTGPRPATHRLGREAVVNPGPADSEIRGTTGGGSGPLDMKDPINPDDPNGPGRPPARP